MKDFIEKLISRLEEEIKNVIVKDTYSKGKNAGLRKAKVVINDIAEEYNNDFCEWCQYDKEVDVYYTECGETHAFIDGSPKENNYEFCPYCGKKIKAVE